MAEPLRPWADHQTLSNLLAGLRPQLVGRPLFRLAAGPRWLRLHLEGKQRPAIWLTWLSGANLVFNSEGPVSPVWKRALPITRRHPLQALLKESRLEGLGMFPEDRVAALRLAGPDGRIMHLMHQLFGSRGNTVLMDAEGKLLWSRHRPPGAVLANPPCPETWETGSIDTGSLLVARLAQGHLATRLTAQHLSQNQTSLGRARRTASRLVENLRRDFERADKSEEYRRKAEALAACLHLIPSGCSEWPTSDLRDGHPLVIALDPALSPAGNLEAWFRRASKAEKGRHIIQERLEKSTEHADKLDLAASLLEEISRSNCQELECLEAVLDWYSAHAPLLPASGSKDSRPRQHGPEEPIRPFRRYVIDRDFEVWVGRNNRENDELTHRASHSKDIWLHAQGVSGSHVILRTGGHPERVPRPVLEKAGSLAALNSKARHSSLVPVIYTERRYVRKPRKSPPGTATCLREKSIFVEPGIAEGVKSI